MSCFLKQMTIARTKQAIVADLDEAIGEHVLEEAADELLGTDGALFELISGGVFIRESDLASLQLAEAVVAEGDAKDVRGEILESFGARAHRLRVNHPIFTPDAGRYLSKKFSLLEGIAELGAEDAGEGNDWHQKVFA